MLSHQNIVAMCRWFPRYYNLDETARVSAYASFGFDASLMDIYPALTVGACAYIIEDEIRLDLIKLNDYFKGNQITHAFMTTQVARQFVVNIENHSLKHLLTGGEKLPTLTPPRYPLHNIYGPTETTVLVTAFPVDAEYPNIPLGKAIDNVKLYVLDEFERQVPIGVPGELCIAGIQVSCGYLNQPEKTKAVFTPNPYALEKPYDRMYHTGDIVRYLTDGNIEFIGRRDAQVKIRGFRIELTEVEEVIRHFEGIQDATVVAYDNAGGGKYIAAYIVADAPIDMDALNGFIESRKPSYMIPAVTLQIDKIPLNQNMKVNKKELPVPVRKTENIVKPENKIQQKIFDCVAKALGHDEFGIHTDFQDAGLTSIGIVSLNVLLSNTFGVAVKTRDLTVCNTIVRLEAFLATADPLSTMEAMEKQEAYPVSETQMGLFVESMAKPESLRYNLPMLFKLHPDVDLDKLKTAIEATLEAHPYIKTRFFMDGHDEIMQRRQDDDPFVVKILNTLDIETLVTPFKLIEGQLFDLSLYDTKEGSFFFMDLHHMICDGTSIAILIEDINRAYAGEKPEPEIYTGFEAALDEKKTRASEVYTQAKAYYASIFKGCDTHFLLAPDKKDDPAPSLGEIAHIPLDLDLESVNAFCHQKKITLNAFFVGVFGYVLGRYNHKDHSVFTTIYNGRNDSRIARSAGMYVKTLPIYCHLTTTVPGLLATTKEQLMNGMDHDIYSFAEISRAFGITPDIIFAYQGDNFEFESIGNLPAENIQVMTDGAIAPISVIMSIQGGKFHLMASFRRDMYDDRTMDALLKNYVLAARQMLFCDDLSQIRLLFDEENKMVDDPRFYGQTFVDLFAKSAQQYPDHIAVKDINGVITYQELDSASDALALSLLSQGLQAQDFVGVLSGRSREFIIGVTAVMKAGGAYVPLDPEYPQDRLRYMLEDSGAKILLSVSDHKDLTRFYKQKTILLDLLPAAKTCLPDKSWMTARPLPENLAYMIYTSGSTGKPKGVMISHGNLSNLIFNETLHNKLDATTQCAEYSSFCFDASVIGIFPALANGCSLYLFAEEDRKDAARVCDILKEEAINVVVFPTQMGEIIVENLREDCDLTYIMLGGEKLKRYYDRPYTLINGYGPTESTVETTTFNVDHEYKNIPIGKSLINVRSYVVDEHLNPVPVGSPGELCHAGRQIARGYHNLKEKTESVFVPNPFSVCKDDRILYRTGDMVLRHGDGNLEYSGRIDSQVKIRGYRIELGEIEGAMSAYPPVGQTTVTVEENSGNKYIVGYYTCDAGEIDPKIWNRVLQPLLPEYMMPSVYVHLDNMRITPGGKIDKKALPKPEINLNTPDYAPPETTLQQTLCSIFGMVLGMETVGINDDFFAVGGTSISAAKVAMKCITQKISITYSDIFEHKTVRKLAEFVESDMAEAMTTNDVIKNFNYERITPMLAKNTVTHLPELQCNALEDIIITGANGFLGIHILKEFLDHYEGRVTCFIRKGRLDSVEERMKTMLFYYFDQDFGPLFGKRIFCVEGDITDVQSVMALKSISAKTLINCAACVKHFVADDSLEKINVTGVKNLITLCKKTDKQLIQISTVSVGGDGKNNTPPVEKRIMENELFFGQDLENAYIHSKFLAERAVVSAIAQDGLNAKIMRVGNLMSRHSDGEFQINFLTNGFMRSLKGYKYLGKFPVSAMNSSVEFSPIDVTADAILKLSETNREFTVFHPYNNHAIFMADVILQMKAYGFDIKIVRDEEFAMDMKAGMENPEISQAISGLIVYLSNDAINTVYPIGPDNRFTTEVLYRINHSWPMTSETYLHKSLKALDELGFFGIEEF
ncbi:non-ribosomal peptide synthetase [Desulfoluna sp.]|uniref:non-ribosomal peptide synthetase n=1 Tax=Desulfoluna sp. TaxID=2045199 RepID=UPI0026271EE8|nr:non-ribosomal peptide synthetase [Desulfoluna sp.]